MKTYGTLMFIILGACAVCHAVEKFKEIGSSGVLTPPPDRPEIPNRYPTDRRQPPSIPVTCLGNSGCGHKLMWPKIDYPPSQPNFRPIEDDFRESHPRSFPERFRRAVRQPLSLHSSQEKRQRRSPLVRGQSRTPVIPYFCHTMPCSGPLSSFPLGKGESSGRYELPERRSMLT